MKITEHLPKFMIVLVLLGGVAAVIYNGSGTSAKSMIVDVSVPQLSQVAALGKQPYDENCAQCHGDNGSGSDNGPPLIHTTYNPGHHADDAFFLAAKRGVKGHHWPFGNMPPQPQVSDRQMTNIIQYIRELQQANGIFYRKHMMQ